MRTTREYLSRPAEERLWMEENTWCENCQEADLGLVSPHEYEEAGRVYLEGKCQKCAARVVTEVRDK